MLHQQNELKICLDEQKIKIAFTRNVINKLIPLGLR